ncbi:hypothetical protein B0H13DRAFT_1853457 [Mycena leptocephala]|nr:hypothetical protein B0H13DRAFT_1853457 [Mycena leptocephala]
MAATQVPSTGLVLQGSCYMVLIRDYATNRRPSPNHPINYAWDCRVSTQILSSFPLLARRKWSQPELLGATGLLRGATGAHARVLPGATRRYQTMARGYEGTIRGTCLRGYHGYLGYQALCNHVLFS